MRTILFIAAALLLFPFSACRQPLAVSPEGTDRGGEYEDFGPCPVPADPGEHFFFLPPLALVPQYNGTFAFGLEPVVRISLEKQAGLETLVEFCTEGSGSERVRLESSAALGDYYIVNFHLKRFNIPPHSKLLIEVLVEGQVLGSLRAFVIGHGSHRCFDLFEVRVPLFHNRTVPIKFRIEQELFEPPTGRIEAWLSATLSESQRAVLSMVPDFDDFIAVAAGSYHAVGLRADGSLVSWGQDSQGEVSDTPPGTGFVAVDAGLLYSLALHEDGTVFAWGGGLAANPDSRPTGTGFTGIAAGYAFAMATDAAGALTAWSLSSAMLPTVPGGTGYAEIKAGSYVAAAIGASGQLTLFGTNTAVVNALVPEGSYSAVDTGEYHAAGVLSDGRLVSWGGSQATAQGLVQDLSDGPYIAVAAGERLGLGLRADGTLKPYGSSPTAASIPTDAAEYFAVAVSPLDSAFAIRRTTTE